MQRLPLRAAGDHRPRCAGIHLRRRRREAQAGKAAGGGGECDLQQLQADDGRGRDVLRVGVGDIDAHDLLAADGGGRGEEAGGGARQHVEWHEMELTPPPPPLRSVVHMNCWRDTGSGQGMQAEERQRKGGAPCPGRRCTRATSRLFPTRRRTCGAREQCCSLQAALQQTK